MKLTIALIVAMAIPAQSMANEPGDSCAMIGQIAEVIMKNRQNQVPLSKAMTALDAIGGDAVLVDSMRGIILAAYDVPGFSSDRAKLRAIKDFRIQVERGCYQ